MPNGAAAPTKSRNLPGFEVAIRIRFMARRFRAAR
jgi:hypothetical protein